MKKSTRVLTDSECRAQYGKIRGRSEAHTAKAFDAAVVAYFRTHGMLGPNGTETIAPREVPPASWLRAAERVTFTCRRCAGTGSFITYVENGQPKGPGGACFRCAGKGTQTDADVTRNEAHDRHYMGRAC